MSIAAKRDRAIESAQDMVHDVAGAARQAGETVKRDAGHVKDAISEGASELASTVSGKLKAVGVDTDAMAHAAKDQVHDLQRMIGDELRNRPMRTIGIAAAIGLAVGFLATR